MIGWRKAFGLAVSAGMLLAATGAGAGDWRMLGQDEQSRLGVDVGGVVRDGDAVTADILVAPRHAADGQGADFYAVAHMRFDCAARTLQFLSTQPYRHGETWGQARGEQPPEPMNALGDRICASDWPAETGADTPAALADAD